VSLSVEGEDHPAVALELSGERAALRVRRPVEPDAPVTVTLAWAGGSATTLPARVRSVTRSREDGSHVAHVDVHAVQGDWRPFLEYLGPAAVGAA
jgi:hypothetical protein